ncbi:hypothetical protein EXIGLDRAFT_778892 [Exidia glandulosa HHB12029]|uniref:Uncharacterized protein n=1 Tax=Exidia glandulosa HHB12029 TaxID=1314781 RepID=A0A165CBQ4_EXIGL|nr:hypothetical protein EXIGLDRAFT_778892 [Exidia glandulosa HHB12029]
MSSGSNAAIRRVTEQKALLRDFETERSRLRIERSNASIALEAAQLALDRAKAELERVEEVCDRLTSSISAEQQDIMSRSLASLPVELLRAIFEEVVFAGDGEWKLDGGDDDIDEVRQESPFDLASVCRTWRRVALDTPSIWNYLVVPQLSLQEWQKQDKPVQPDKVISYLKLLIGRSKKEPLDISVWWCFESKFTPQHHEVLQLLADEHRRWRCLIVIAPDSLPPGSNDAMWRLLYLPTPQLESVYVQDVKIHGTNDALSSAYFPDRRRLRHFVSATYNVMWIRPQPTHPSVLIRVELTIDGDMPISIVWRLLEECASTLQVIRISATQDSDLDAPPRAPTTFPALHTLSGCGSPEGVFAHWAGCMIAPRLQTFLFEDGDISIARDFVAFTCKDIARLELRDCLLSEEAAFTLRPLMRLTTMVMEWSPLDADFLASFVDPLPGDIEGSWMCPMLSTIVLHGFQKDATNIPLLAQVLRNRRLPSIEGRPGAPARISAVEYEEYCRIDPISRLLLAAELEDDVGTS